MADPASSSPALRAQLANAVADVESGSSVELVVLVAERSGAYPEAGWALGVVAMVAVFATLMFHEAEIGDYTLFLAPLVALALGLCLPLLVPRLRALLTPSATRARQVELVARATFQKAGLSATRDSTALLVYCSLLERAVFLVPDRAVAAAVPPRWLDETRARFVAALRSRDPAALVQATRALGPELARHLPRRPDDMNELPDAIDVAF